MTCRVLGMPNRKLALQLSVFGDKCAEDDSQYMDNLRLILAVAMAKYADEHWQALDQDRALSDLSDVVMAQPMYELGRAKVIDGNKEALWMYGYINHTRVTSEWAQKAYPGCSVQITARIVELRGNFENVVDAHTLVFYF